MANFVRRMIGVGAAGLMMMACSSASSVPDDDDAGMGGDADPAGLACSRITNLCGTGRACAGAPDCTSGLCLDGTCRAVSPKDNTKNGDETDVDCGGTKAPACTDGKSCGVARDCTSGVCTGTTCQAPSPTDGVQNGDETGVDCGGTKAPKCSVGLGCKVSADCNNVLCDPATDTCAPPSHVDHLHNGDETGVDCGGPTAAGKCLTGDGCTATADCDRALCNVSQKCDAPSKADGVTNGTETDKDCGGGAPTNADRCAISQICAVDGDCTSSACSYGKVCVEAPSCKTQYGGDTCGKGEVGAAGHVHESCCKSVPLADNSARVDKYEITAGRMRAFIAAVGNDVQTWVTNHRAITTQIPDGLVQYLPTSLTTPSHPIVRCNEAGQNCVTQSQSFGVYDHLGNNVFMPDRPCPNCGQGCYIGTIANGGYGHPTYYWDDATQTNQFGSQKRKFSQTDLDVKSLNCTPQLLFAAFCAWDGGRLPTQPELAGQTVNSAWGDANRPWGNAMETDTVAPATDPGRLAYPFTSQYDNGTDYLVPGILPSVLGASNIVNSTTYNWTNWNPFRKDNGQSTSMPYFKYIYPFVSAGGWDQTDQAFAIAAPGRMINDHHAAAGGDGWNDVGANLLEVTATVTRTADDANHNGWPGVAWVGGSFEGHAIGRGGFDLNVLTKYGKQGARCARAF